MARRRRIGVHGIERDEVDTSVRDDVPAPRGERREGAAHRVRGGDGRVEEGLRLTRITWQSKRSAMGRREIGETMPIDEHLRRPPGERDVIGQEAHAAAIDAACREGLVERVGRVGLRRRAIIGAGERARRGPVDADEIRGRHDAARAARPRRRLRRSR